jgi:hypothetical protein
VMRERDARNAESRRPAARMPRDGERIPETNDNRSMTAAHRERNGDRGPDRPQVLIQDRRTKTPEQSRSGEGNPRTRPVDHRPAANRGHTTAYHEYN